MTPLPIIWPAFSFERASVAWSSLNLSDITGLITPLCVMAEMNKRYDITNAVLTSTLDRLKRGKMQISSQFYSRIADTFITRSDAQNYMIFGDPAARLRMQDM
jgi:hypothetical protein